MRPLYTIQELAQTLRLQPGTLRNKLSRGDDLPRSVVIGRRRLFPEDGVEAWVLGQEARQAGSSLESLAPTDAPKPVGRPRRPSKAQAPVRGSARRKTRSATRRGCAPAQIGLFGRDVE